MPKDILNKKLTKRQARLAAGGMILGGLLIGGIVGLATGSVPAMITTWVVLGGLLNLTTFVLRKRQAQAGQKVRSDQKRASEDAWLQEHGYKPRRRLF